MEILKFSAVTFQSNDPERLAAFYRDKVGLPLRWDQHGNVVPHHEGDLGAVHLAVLPAQAGAGGPVVPVFRVRDLEASISELRSKDVEMVLKPLALDEGMTVAGFKDPDGNTFRLIEFKETSPR
jgi:predicted enzyme related to lactoylglutathione lyase